MHIYIKIHYICSNYFTISYHIMKKQILSLILFLLIYIYIVTCTACSNRSPSTDHIEALFKEYGIRKYNYFITDDNKTLTKNNFNETTNLGEKWIETLSLPLILTKEIRNEHINEDSLLRCYMSIRSINKEKLLVKDIIHIPENQPSILPLYNENISFYMKHLIHRQFPEAYNDFYKNTLKIEEKHSWNTKNILTTTKYISSYFDEQNITEYMPIGKDIPNLFPTWYVENIYQLAGWYTFRLNKHVVLWSSMSDESQTLLCIKFIDLRKTIAIIYPNKEGLSPFDSNGNPDLLLSPIALDILKNTFEPNYCKIDFNQSKEKLCLQLKEKRKSPHIALYIKELQSHIRLASRINNHNEYQKLKEVYDTLFPHSLPCDYLKASPLTAINYVSDRMNASRYFILNEESNITIFHSNQRRKYIAKDKSTNDSIVFADKCWIIKEQSQEIIWKPAMTNNIPVQIIGVEKYDTILAPGKYIVRYESDGKHSFESWLSFPPLIDDYGIRIYKK